MLPSEILLIIFGYLPLQDIQRLRLVSQHYHNCASQSLIRSLRISSDPRSLKFWENISSSDLFRRGVSRIVYNTGLTYQPRPGFMSKNHEKRGNPIVRDYFTSAIDQCYNVYYPLRAGIPHLPMLREVVITDQVSQSSIYDLSGLDLNTSQSKTRIMGYHDSELSLFILLRALSAVNLAPKRFDLHVQRFVPGSTRRSQALISSKEQPTSLNCLFDKCLGAATQVFKDLRELNISTRGPGLEGDVSYATAFIVNLSALVFTAGPQLERLQVVVQDMPIPPDIPEYILFSTLLFKKSPTCWPMLRSLELRGVDVSGFELIAFISQQMLLEKVLLQDIYLTQDSPAWTSIIDDLCFVLGAQFEDMKAGSGHKRRSQVVMPMERIQLHLNHVFEPWDGGLDDPLTVKPDELRGFFGGREENPLRDSYESFIIADEF
jgi:hypothetical protein